MRFTIASQAILAATAANGLAISSIPETVTDADASDIINTLSSSTEPHVASISARLVAIHDNLKKIGVAGIAKGTLDNINADQKAFGAALVKQAPADKKAEAQALADKFTSDLAPAVAAYASD